MQQDSANTNWGFVAKCVGGMFATIVAPLLVTMMAKRLDPPPPVVAPPAAPALAPTPVATVPAPANTLALAPAPVATASAPASIPALAPTPVTTAPAPADAPVRRLQQRAGKPAPASEPTKVASNMPNRTESPTIASASTTAGTTPAGTTPRKRSLDHAFPKAKFVSLFDGKTLSGWNSDGVKHWSVVGGAITGRLGPNAADVRDFLSTTTNYRNFVLTARFKCTSGDAGILFRGKPNSLVAMQVFIGKVKPGALASMTDDSPRDHDQKFHVIIENPAVEKLFVHDGWNDITIAANNDRIRCEINEQPAFDTQYSDGPRGGVISFKLKQGTEVAFKDIRVARLGE